VAVGAGLNVCSDSEAPAKQKAFALGNIPLIEVVGHAVPQPRIAEDEVEASPQRPRWPQFRT